MLSSVFGVLGGLVAVSGNVPYIAETVKGKTKPRLVTWLTWTLLTALASAAAFSDHQIAAGSFALLGTLATGTILVIGWRYGDRSFGRLDIACLVGVIIGLMAWLLLNTPAIGVWAAIIIDCIGLIPTIRHAWQAPAEETPSTYILVCIGGMMAVAAVAATGQISVTAIGYPLYTAVSLGAVGAIVLLRRRPKAVTNPAEAADE